MLTQKEIIDLINTRITAPIPIHVVEKAPEMTIDVGGQKSALVAFYLPDKRLIEIYVDQIPVYVKTMIDLFERLGLKPERKNIRDEVLILSIVVHVLRHYDQHMVLCERFDEKEGTEKFKELIQAGEYSALVQDAQLAQFGVFLDLNEVIELAITGKQLPLEDISADLGLVS